MREGLNPWFLLVLKAAGMVLRAQRGGCTRISGLGLPQPHSAICLIPLWLSHLNRPARYERGKKAGTRAPPPKQGGHADTDSGAVYHASIRSHDWSLSSSFIPAGRLGTAPLSPRASSCRIGPRRQGFASPLRALDGSGPIRGATLFTRGKGAFGPWGAEGGSLVR